MDTVAIEGSAFIGFGVGDSSDLARVWQTFTLGLTGQLVEVGIGLDGLYVPNATVVAITKVDTAGKPLTEELASAKLAAPRVIPVTGDVSLWSFALNSPLAVNSGDRLAISLSTSASNRVLASASDSYSGGALYGQVSPNEPIQPVSEYKDLTFRTLVAK